MSRNSKKINTLLWVAQILLAALFVFAGVSKFIMPVAAMQQGPVVLSGWFLHFIGVAEVLGALGLVLPGVFKIRQYLTPLAAAGLVVIMAGATVITAVGSIAGATIPFVVGILLVAVYRGRGGLAARAPRRATVPTSLLTNH